MDHLENDDLRLAKTRLREEMRSMLAALSPEIRAEWSRQIVSRLLTFEQLVECKGPVLAFLATSTEPDLDPLIRSLARPICLPAIDWEMRTMTPVAIDSAQLETRVQRHGIREPVGADAVEPGELGAIIVPGLAFDDAGGRLGRGAGFYDRFLGALERREAANQPHPVVIGVGFEFQLVDDLPTSPLDHRVDHVVVPSRMIRCHA